MVLGTVGRAVVPRVVAVANVLKVMDLRPGQEDRCRNAMHVRITPTLIEELHC